MPNTIIISESQLHIITEYENREILPGDFKTAVRGYLEELRVHPIKPNYSQFFIDNNIKENDLQNKMISLGIISKEKEGFKEPEDANGKKQSFHYKKFKFFGKDFETKLDKLYDDYFTRDYKRKESINEEGEMGGGALACDNFAVGTSDQTMGTIFDNGFNMITKPKYNSYKKKHSKKKKITKHLNMKPAMNTKPGFSCQRIK